MPNNGKPLIERARELADEGEAEIARLEQEIQERLDQVRSLRSMRRALRALSPKAAKPKAKPKKGQVADATLLSYANDILDNGFADERFSSTDLGDAIGKEGRLLSPRLGALVDAGILIRAGKAFPDPENPKGLPRQMFRIDPDEGMNRIEELRTTVNATA